MGDYYKGGLKPVDGIVVTEYDRAAPKGVGSVKVREQCGERKSDVERRGKR